MATERDQHWSKLTKETKSELKLDTSIPESTLARGLGSQSWTGVAAITSWLGWADCQGVQRVYDWPIQREGGLPPGPPPGSAPYLTWTTPPSCRPGLRGAAHEVFVSNLGSPLPPQHPGPPPDCSASQNRLSSQTSIAPHFSPPLQLRPGLASSSQEAPSRIPYKCL